MNYREIGSSATIPLLADNHNIIVEKEENTWEMSRPPSRSASRPSSRPGSRAGSRSCSRGVSAPIPGPSRTQELHVNLKDCENLIRHRIVGLPGQLWEASIQNFTFFFLRRLYKIRTSFDNISKQLPVQWSSWKWPSPLIKILCFCDSQKWSGGHY